MPESIPPPRATISDRHVAELVARCVSIMVAYRGEGHDPHTWARMSGDVHDVAREALGCGMVAREVESRIVAVVKVELMDRYGSDDGGNLHGAFLAALEEEAGSQMGADGHPRILRPLSAR